MSLYSTESAALLYRCPAQVRSCKTCPDAEQGIVVGGEYGISVALLEVRACCCSSCVCAYRYVAKGAFPGQLNGTQFYGCA